MKPIFLICEDGTEYQDRLERFLGSEFRFVRADSFSALVAALDAHGAAAGLVLDLDFRRTPAEQLVDEAGASIALHEKARVAALQGLFILRALRGRRGVPWQRVVGARPRGLASVTIKDPIGAAIQRKLLEAEGVRFDARQRIALAEFGWPGPRRNRRLPKRGGAGRG